MKLTRFLLIPVLALCSCAGPLVVAGVGAVAGVWTVDEFRNDSGEILLNASPQDAFAICQATINSRANITDLEVTKGSLRIEFKEDQVHYSVMVMLLPDNGQFCKLRVIAAEFGMRGRAELAEALAEEIASKI
ncbi:MAG: hypothetical protein QGF46_05855 [Planctomycetota bacterium]|jgi:hypothetical protein|nr:hypothetical protein [Planctomycetota bacterium]